MLKIEVKSEQVKERSGKTNGRDWLIREQTAYWHQEGEPVPVKILVNLERDQVPYKPGFYTVLPSSFYVGKYGQMTLGRLQLSAPVAVKAV